MEVKSVMTCPHCHQTDFTDFSKCRYCGHNYDGSSESSYDGLSSRQPKYSIMMLVVLVVVLGSAYLMMNANSKRADTLEPMRQEIAAVGRPRAIIFMNDWEAPGQPYIATVNDEALKYGSSVDFYRLSMTDPTNKDLMERLGVQFSPTTSIFAANGRESKTITGNLDHADLERYLNNAVRQSEPLSKQNLLPSP
jgi:hypothetical protein